MNDSNAVTGGRPDLSPGDIGRLAIWTDPHTVALQLHRWSDDNNVADIVAGWFADVAGELRIRCSDSTPAREAAS